MSTSNQLDLETIGFGSVVSKNLLKHCSICTRLTWTQSTQHYTKGILKHDRANGLKFTLDCPTLGFLLFSQSTLVLCFEGVLNILGSHQPSCAGSQIAKLYTFEIPYIPSITNVDALTQSRLVLRQMRLIWLASFNWTPFFLSCNWQSF